MDFKENCVAFWCRSKVMSLNTCMSTTDQEPPSTTDPKPPSTTDPEPPPTTDLEYVECLYRALSQSPKECLLVAKRRFQVGCH